MSLSLWDSNLFLKMRTLTVAPTWMRLLLVAMVIQCVASARELDEVAVPQAVHFNTGGLSRETFPKGFMFGASASAYQVEGMAHKDGRGPSIWDAFVQEPGNIAGNGTGEVATDQYHRYKEDVDMIKRLNFDAYRFSISWPRIFRDGTGKVNWKGVAYYNRLIDYLIEKGLAPCATLYYYDLPLALDQKYKGLLSRRMVLSETVKNWMTFNEPRVIAAFGYDDGTHPPGRCSKVYGNCSDGDSPTEPYIVTHNILLSHAAAVQRYREKYQEKQKGRIGIVVDFVWYEPLTRSKADNYAALRANRFSCGMNIVGERLPKFTEEEVMLVKGSTDFVGINQYTTNYAYHDPLRPKPQYPSYQTDWNVGFAYEKNGRPIGLKGNAYGMYNVPWGMYKVLTYMKEHYGNPILMVSENGVDDAGNVPFAKALLDTRRVKYYKTYMRQLKRAIDHGANIVGYFAWSLLDNFEWTLGYTSRFGIVYVDFHTLQRYPKMSAFWFKELLARKKH